MWSDTDRNCVLQTDGDTRSVRWHGRCQTTGERKSSRTEEEEKIRID